MQKVILNLKHNKKFQEKLVEKLKETFLIKKTALNPAIESKS